MTEILAGDPATAKSELERRLVGARNDLLVVLRTLPAPLRERPGVAASWSAKDLAGHVASWESRYLTLIQHLINGQGERIRWISGDQARETWNHKEWLRKRNWTWQEVIRDLALMREELLWNLGWATPEQVFREQDFQVGSVSPARLLDGLIEHDQEHTAQLLAWLAQESP